MSAHDDEAALIGVIRSAPILAGLSGPWTGALARHILASDWHTAHVAAASRDAWTGAERLDGNRP